MTMKTITKMMITNGTFYIEFHIKLMYISYYGHIDVQYTSGTHDSFTIKGGYLNER